MSMPKRPRRSRDPVQAAHHYLLAPPFASSATGV
jgi:hypothetical protein